MGSFFSTDLREAILKHLLVAFPSYFNTCYLRSVLNDPCVAPGVFEEDLNALLFYLRDKNHVVWKDVPDATGNPSGDYDVRITAQGIDWLTEQDVDTGFPKQTKVIPLFP